MRKIESEMNFNIMMGRDWKQANTSTQRASSDNAVMMVRLHGHHIATVWGACHGRDQWQVEVNTNTLRAWPTRTTMSRLRALGADVCTRKGEVLLNGEAI